MKKSKQKFSTKIYLALAKDYADLHGNLDVKYKYVDPVSQKRLGLWLYNIRRFYQLKMKVDPEIVETLSALDKNFFAYRSRRSSWNEDFLNWVKEKSKGLNPLPTNYNAAGISEDERRFRAAVHNLKYYLKFPQKSYRNATSKLVKQILQINPNALVTREQTRDKKFEEYLIWLKEKSSFDPSFQFYLKSKSSSPRDKKFFYLTRLIRKFVQNPGTAKVKFPDHFVEEIRAINPYILMNEDDFFALKRSEYLDWVKSKPRTMLATGKIKNITKTDKRFFGLTRSIKQAISSGHYSKFITPEFISEVLKINPNAFMTLEEYVEKRNCEYLEWLKQQPTDQPVKISKNPKMSEKDKYFVGMSTNLKVFVKNAGKVRNRFSPDFITQIKSINPYALMTNAEFKTMMSTQKTMHEKVEDIDQENKN